MKKVVVIHGFEIDESLIKKRIEQWCIDNPGKKFDPAQFFSDLQKKQQEVRKLDKCN